MSVKREEAKLVSDFGQRYRTASATVPTTVERRVLGSDFGANGFTTVSQADELGRRLGLRPGERLLDLGAGCGWPGLYLAIESGCSVVSTDLPFEGLLRARQRGSREGLVGRSSAVLSSARRLPFRRRAFDAIVHTDVLC